MTLPLYYYVLGTPLGVLRGPVGLDGHDGGVQAAGEQLPDGVGETSDRRRHTRHHATVKRRPTLAGCGAARSPGRPGGPALARAHRLPAARIGERDATNFFKFFRHRTGTTPGTFRAGTSAPDL